MEMNSITIGGQSINDEKNKSINLELNKLQ